MNLWPDFNLGEAEPIAILKTQAILLGEKTRARVVGEVSVHLDKEQQKLRATLFLKCPELSQYHHKLLDLIAHSNGDYPVHITVREVGAVAKNEQELRDTLRHIFHSERTQGIIRAIADYDMEALKAVANQE